MTWDLVRYLRVSAARISIVFLSVLGQIGQKDMGFSSGDLVRYLRVSAARISDVSWELQGNFRLEESHGNPGPIPAILKNYVVATCVGKFSRYTKFSRLDHFNVFSKFLKMAI